MKTYFYIIFVLLTYLNVANAEVFGEWTAIKVVNEDSKSDFQNSSKPYCYIYTTPYRTKAYSSSREEPYLLVAKKGINQFGIGVSSGFVVSKSDGFTLKVNGRSHLLNVISDQNANTFSSIQDIAIINDMIEDGMFVEIRSYQDNENEASSAVDYYSLKGFTKAMQFLNKCKLP